jgi:hypothetical protein
MLGWFIGPDASSRQLLWSVLNEILPETNMGARDREILEKRAQKIIRTVQPVHPHVSDVQLYLEEFVSVIGCLVCCQTLIINIRTSSSTA